MIGRQSLVPVQLEGFIERIDYGTLGNKSPEVNYEVLSKDLIRVSLLWKLDADLQQDDWRVEITPKFDPGFHWAPHLTPTAEHIIAQHVFRAPALIVSSSDRTLAIVPDLDVLAQGTPVGWYMDLDAPNNKLSLGMSKVEVNDHVLFLRAAGASYPPGELKFAFYIMASAAPEDVFNPWRKVLAFLWERWGSALYSTGQPLERKDLDVFVDHTYEWAMNRWRDSVWQEFEIQGQPVGAAAFIVNVTHSPNYPGHVDEREFNSIWNQAWFNSLRSAQGLYRYGRRTGNQLFIARAQLTKELALAFPQNQGFFPGLIATYMEQVEIDGQLHNRRKGWGEYFFGNSNRNPYSISPLESPLHILDMSVTAFQMLLWFEELEPDQRLVDYAVRYAEALLSVQDEHGFFPGWLDPVSLQPREHLNRSPESSMSVSFLLKLHSLTQDQRYLAAALKAMDAVVREIIPIGQWEDFETYWSCSRYGADHLVGQRVARNRMFKQNTLSMFWTAEALLESYRATADERYLNHGRRTLDEMLMAQAVWQPPYIYVSTLGGFGVMNADAEWNDARQSLFAPLILEYAKVFDSQEYLQRGLAALRSSFTMMYCPENPKTRQQWERKWPFFGPEDYGFMMENYGHHGVTAPDGLGIGRFTIYDWGNGSAAEAYNRLVDRFGKDFVLDN